MSYNSLPCPNNPTSASGFDLAAAPSPTIGKTLTFTESTTDPNVTNGYTTKYAATTSVTFHAK